MNLAKYKKDCWEKRFEKLWSKSVGPGELEVMLRSFITHTLESEKGFSFKELEVAAEDGFRLGKESERKEIKEALLEYVSHDEDCILSQFDAGRPTKDGGYEQKFAGKWYQVRPIDKKPKCSCGLDDILRQL